MATLNGSTPAATYSQLLYREPSPAGGTRNIRRDNGSGAQVIQPIHVDETNGRFGVMTPGGPTYPFEVVGASKFGGPVYHPVTTQSVIGAVSVNATLGKIFILTLTGNISSFGITGGVIGQEITVHFVQGGVGGWTFPLATSNIGWEGSTPIVLAATAGKRDTLTLQFDGTNWWEVACKMNVGV